jgi:hypothetical protein
MQLHVIELSTAIQRLELHNQRLLEGLIRAIDALRQFPEKVFGWSINPGGGRSSELYQLIADLECLKREELGWRHHTT